MGNVRQLNQSKPLLKDCDLFEGEMNVVVEDKTSKAQVVLPKENLSVLKLLNGENSIKDISTELYLQTGQVNFHSIMTTIKLLSEADLLEESDQNFKNLKDEKSPHEQKSSILGRPLKEWQLKNKFQVGMKSDYAFFAGVMIIAGILAMNYQAFTQLNIARFLKSPSGYEEALIRIFFFTSALLTLKSFFQGILLLSSTGTFYGPYLRVYPYALSIGINDNSIYSHPKKAVIISYGLISSLLYLVIAAGLQSIPMLRPYRNDLAVIGMLLTFIELNPYRRSDLTRLFYFFYADSQLKNIMPYLKNCTIAGLWKDTGAKLSDEVRYISYSVLAISWAIGFSFFSLQLVLKCFPGLFYQIQLGTTESRFAAVIVLAMLFFITGYLILDLFHTLIQNIISPLLLPLMKLKRRGKEITSSEFTEEDIRKCLKSTMLFNQFSEEGLEHILSHASLKMKKKGSHLIIQGDDSREVFFLMSGSVDVSVTESTGRHKHIASLGAGSVLGEMSIFDKVRRTANINAAEDIIYLEINEKAFEELTLLEKFKQDCRNLKERIQLSQFVASADLFKDFPPEIMNLFVEAGDLVLFPRGHHLVDEGEKDKTFYLLIKGKVDVWKAGEKVAELSQGDFFGEIALIANVPRTATVKTVEDCLFLYIEDKKFWDILSGNIELATYIESVGRLRMKAAA